MGPVPTERKTLMALDLHCNFMNNRLLEKLEIWILIASEKTIVFFYRLMFSKN